MYNNQQNQQYDNEGRVSVWQGDKRKSPNGPDLKGTLTVNGVEYNISLWNNQKRTSQNAPVMNGQVEVKQAAPRPQGNQGYNAVPQQQYAPQPAQAPAPQAAPQQQGGFQSDEIPF